MLTICLASVREAGAFSRAADPEPGVSIRVTGHRNRLVHAARLEPGGDFLIAGFAGALDPALSPGHLFLPETVHALSRGPAAPDAHLQSAIRALLSERGLPFAGGDLVTTDRPVVDPEHRGQLLARGFRAVDMETHGLLESLARQGARVAVLRLLSDRADEKAADEYESRMPVLSETLGAALSLVANNLTGLSRS